MENSTFIYATYIRTTPEKLWEALTRGDFSKSYWFGYRIEPELRPGGSVRIIPPNGSGAEVAGEVLVCEPGRKLVYTWQRQDKPEVARQRTTPSRVTYELTPMGGQMRLRLIHENLLPADVEPNPDTFQGVNNGWPAVLSSLKSLLETGEAITFSRPAAR